MAIFNPYSAQMAQYKEDVKREIERQKSGMLGGNFIAMGGGAGLGLSAMSSSSAPPDNGKKSRKRALLLLT